MREIKFRAWDGEKMSCSKVEYFDDMVGLRFKHFDIDCEKPTLMQYTNLKDKNGKEIYEGDIISIFNSEINVEFIGVVKFEDCCFAISIKKQYGGKSDVTGVRSTLLGVTDNEYIVTLLGNIYENADLLEVEE